jgi:hypothetical protein
VRIRGRQVAAGRLWHLIRRVIWGVVMRGVIGQMRRGKADL